LYDADEDWRAAEDDDLDIDNVATSRKDEEPPEDESK
jgi:hypothetical protein